MISPSVVRLASPEETQALVREARRHGTPLHPFGAGTRAGSVRPAGQEVHVAADAGEWLHHPEDLLVTAPAGMTLDELRERLANCGQALPLDAPPGGTVGGLVAHGTTGPRLHGPGLPRTWVVGLDTVLGTGERMRVGARVVKNVAGYDGVRLWCGSRGTLGFILSVTFKVAALPEAWTESISNGHGEEALARALAPLRRIPLDWLRLVPDVASSSNRIGSPQALLAPGRLPWRGGLAWRLVAGVEGHVARVDAVSAGWSGTCSGSTAGPDHWQQQPPYPETRPPDAAWVLALLPSRLVPLLGGLASWLDLHAAEGREWTWRADPGRGRLDLALWCEDGAPLPPVARMTEASGGLWQQTRGPGHGTLGPARTDLELSRDLKRTCDPDDIMNPDILPGCLT
ncbi:MAG: FAD-binding oxidoreductase [Candidatus Sericytochromatia bacterium]|nr:FAD-binding oxidoreductase [Candidatus Sericytochromatia bacterium]